MESQVLVDLTKEAIQSRIKPNLTTRKASPTPSSKTKKILMGLQMGTERADTGHQVIDHLHLFREDHNLAARTDRAWEATDRAQGRNQDLFAAEVSNQRSHQGPHLPGSEELAGLRCR